MTTEAPALRGSLTGERAVGVLDLRTDGEGRLSSFYPYLQSRFTDPAVQLVNQFANGSFLTSPDVSALFTEAELRSTWQLMLDDGGPVIEVGAAEVDGLRTFVPLTLDHGYAELTVAYGGRGGPIRGMTLLKTDPVLEPITRAVVADLVAHRWSDVRDHFDDRMTAALSETKLADSWQEVVSLNGAFLDVLSLRTTNVKGATVQIATCRLARGDVAVQIAYDDRRRISGLYLRPA